MKLQLKIFAFLVATMPASLTTDAEACASFSFKQGDSLVFARNVDSSAGDSSDVNGLVVVNKRGVYKEGASFNLLYGGKKGPLPVFSWVSKYGSVTFNFIAAEFPDGGMNEAGLFLEEMTLIATKYPQEKNKPKLFMVLWIQYILDTCRSVSEVVESAKNINLDGWNWQFYTADKSGDSAVIEFLDGKPVIHRGESLPYPILTNSIYAKEAEKIKTFQGFGGKEPLDVKDYDGPSRFIRGADMIRSGPPSKDITPVDYGFQILDTISPIHMKKWNKNSIVTTLAKVYDVKNRRIYFRTNTAKKIRYLDIDAFDYSCKKPSMILSMHADLSGNVTSLFSPYSEKVDLSVLGKSFQAFSKNPEFQQYLTQNNIQLESIIRWHADHKNKTRCTTL